MSNEHQSDVYKLYQIKVRGHLDKEWAEWIDEMNCVHEEDGTTTLTCALPDQTALHSILRKIRDLNLQLILVQECEPNQQNPASGEIEGNNLRTNYSQRSQK